MQQYTTPFKTHSVPFKANGVFYGVVVAVNDKRLDIKVPRMTGDAVFKNIEYVDSGLSELPAAGELVLVAFLEGKKDDLVVLGRVKSSLDHPDVDLTGLQTGDVLQYDGIKFVPTQVSIDLVTIDLGTDTVGNYVATITGTPNEIDVTGSGTETAAVTLSLPATINADTTGSAAKWTNSRTITLGGDLTGSVSIDGSANATLTATIAANSVALGTDTTGDYVSTITAGTGVSFSAGSGTGEGSTPTLAIGQSVATDATPSFSRVTSTVATGTAPLTVASTTLVSNLNADLLDGQHGTVYAPTGMIVQFAAASSPSGWLLCDGSLVLKATYPDLWALLGSTYGTPTSTQFYLPDLRGRIGVGLDNMGGSDAGRLNVTNTLGGSGGVQEVTLNENNLPQHTHAAGTLATNTTGSHSHTVYGVSDIGNGSNPYGIASLAAISSDSNKTTVAAGDHSHTISGSTGNNTTSVTAVNNMQPYILLNYIIKT